MTEANILETVRQAFQDLIAPDIRELKANHVSLEKITEVRFAAVSERFTSFEKRMDDRFDGVAKQFEGVSDRFTSLEKRLDDRFDGVAKQFEGVSDRFTSFEKRLDDRFDGVAKQFEGVSDRFTSLEKRLDDRFDAMSKQMQAESEKRDAQFAALLAHLREASAEARNATTQQVYDLAQRLTAVETRQSLEHPRQLT